MAAAAPARRPVEVQPPYEVSLRAVERAPRTRPKESSRSPLARVLVIFVICLAVLAAGRVAMSFAVVQKSVATDALASQERLLAGENAQLTEKIANLGSTVRVRAIAERDLGFVEAQHVRYLAAAKGLAAKADKAP